MKFKELLKKEILFFDGAMGTMLQAQGLKPGELPEIWNFTHPEVIQNVHRSYIDAGANLIKTNTFGANALKFPQGGEYTVEDVVCAAVENARKAINGKEKTFIALNLGPTGKLLEPYGDLPFEEAVKLYAETVKAGVKAGVDVVLIETMSDNYEAKAAILAAKENSDLPIISSFTFDIDGKLLTGASVTSTCAMAEGLGVDIIGFNCGLGPEQILNFLEEGLSATDLPFMINPNAGLPVERDGKTYFDVDPDEFANIMSKIAEKGIAILGGCCGTTPAHIQKLVEVCKDYKPFNNAVKKTIVAAYGNAVVFNEEAIIIGERINPTGKPRLKQAILDEDFDYISKLGIEQIEKGAHVLDVNVGVPGIDEPKILEKAILTLQGITSVPLQIDTSNYEAMEKALRIYNGKPLLNSVNGKEESMTKVLPLVKKYGAVVVALCLDDNGIPEDAAGRIEIGERIIHQAALYGIDAKNIIIDPLALTISTGSENAKVDLEIIRHFTAKGIKTIMGVSNISFGLPNRDAVNTTFFALALEAGLSCGIINPNTERMMETYYAYNALGGFDDGCKAYTAQFVDKPKEQAVSAGKEEYSLTEAIIKGLSKQSCEAVKKLLTTEEPLDIINKYMIPALNVVGEEFEQKRLFLPQLLMSADSAKAAFEIIKDFTSKNNIESDKQVIVMATVKGDIHDIGKNIVKVLLENYGYRIVDLGKDVAPETIVAAVVEYKAELVGLSALMTTTVGAMEETIKELRKVSTCKIVVGGAVLTEEYAARIGADAYAATAINAVNYANEILK